ncbi:bifunctional riboflavin kinase/FAD synthetase [Peptostreptococcus russellii]|uniref:bifunctional riboflavin kinase/FAD synthetase n=1 Tax=Peptostreptococcus russellii TaxID=215200 RepID=UPI002943733F|nr:bifunctional riboflavin kinase/FAD synthetase [Peptostreptococcus russellii]
MKVYKNLDDIDFPFDTCVTIGNFDGVHKGHQTLINKTIKYSRENNLKSVVFTFSNHPVNYFKPGHVKNIISYKEKYEVIERMGVDIYISIPFDESMTQISAEDYVSKILVEKLHVKKMVIGHDFTFARQREGNPEVLKELAKKNNFDVEVVDPVIMEGRRISSTDIRRAITEGDVVEAEELLGRYFAVEGEVIKGRQIGRKLGFPTANIQYDNNMVIPQIGIYATFAVIDGEVYCGATSIGTNPTVNGKDLSIETYILDFDENIYGKDMRVEFIEKMRDEIKFDGVEGLKLQLEKDTKYVKENYFEILNKNNNISGDYKVVIENIRKQIESKK